MRVPRFQSPIADPQRPGGHGRRPLVSLPSMPSSFPPISEFGPSSLPDLMAEPELSTTRLTVVDLLDALCASASSAEVADIFNALGKVYELPWGPAHVEELSSGNPLSAQKAAQRPSQGVVVEVPEEYELRMVRRGKVQHLHSVMPHVKRTSLTVTWDAATYQMAGKGEFYEAMSDFESGQALRLALRLPGQRRFIVAFDTDAALLKDAGQRLPLIAQIQLFAIHLNEAAWAVCHARHQVSPLTARETEVLLSTLAGRTVYEVGQQLKLSEAMVAKHGNSAATSLGCVGKHQATARALHMGWLGA